MNLRDNSLDNEHKCQIMATISGVYENKKNVEIGIRIDNTLCDGRMKAKGDILPMPVSHYTLSDDKIVIKKGQVLGGVTVNLTDAYFSDPKSAELNYVICSDDWRCKMPTPFCRVKHRLPIRIV